MKCLESRLTSEGIRRRRYLLEDGQRKTTYEIPEDVIKSIGWCKVKRYIGERARGEQARKRAEQVKETVRQFIDWKPAALAHQLGVTEQHIRVLKRQILRESQ